VSSVHYNPSESSRAARIFLPLLHELGSPGDLQNFASGEAKFRHPFFKSQTRLHDPPSGVKRVSVWLRLRLRWLNCHARLAGDVALLCSSPETPHFISGTGHSSVRIALKSRRVTMGKWKLNIKAPSLHKYRRDTRARFCFFAWRICIERFK
jgi:hypothetical protein